MSPDVSRTGGDVTRSRTSVALAPTSGSTVSSRAIAHIQQFAEKCRDDVLGTRDADWDLRSVRVSCGRSRGVVVLVADVGDHRGAAGERGIEAVDKGFAQALFEPRVERE